MGQPQNTFDTYDAVGIREDLSDFIYDISPLDCPFMQMIGRGRATNTYHEWQTDALASADDTNALIEGDDPTLQASVATARVGNRTQIVGKTVVVSGTQDEVTKAGRRRETAYQLTKRGKELKRDMEAIITRNKPSATGNATTPRTLGSFESWITTNTNRGAGGGNGGFSGSNVTAPTDDVSPRALTEAMMKDVIQQIWTSGGDGSVILAGPKQKQNISAFVGPNAQFYRFDKSEDKKMVTSVDIYVSDFGTHRVVADRFNRDRTLGIITPSMWSLDYLRSMRQWELGKSGDNTKRQMLAEFTLRSSNEAASGVVADLTV